MKVRIEAQLVLRGTMRCELVLSDGRTPELRMPARLTEPDDEHLRALLASGEKLVLEVDAPPLEQVNVSLKPYKWLSTAALETAISRVRQPSPLPTDERNDHES